jgi:hypothetical protein
MPRKKVYELSEQEIKLLEAGIEDPYYISNYFFRPPGGEAWNLDENFDPEGAWQKAVHHAAQKRVIVVGGFGSGKTKGIAASAVIWCMLTRDFKFMNCAPAAWQSELMYSFITEDLARDTVFGKMIWAKPKRPYPKVEIRFRIHGVTIHSTMEFMSVDKNASAILSWEGDWVNVDEAGLIDDLEQTIINLGSRLRGHAGGRPRLGRMSLTTNSWDNPELWYRYDLARELPEDYLSLTASSRHNHNITPDQLKFMLKDVPEDEHDRFIDGARPEGRGRYFNKQKVYACEDEEYGNWIVGCYNGDLPGFKMEKRHGCGIVHFETDYKSDSIYMLLGDPGNGDAPNRNAPVCQVWDVSKFPKYKASLAALWWGQGNGSITPFIRQFLLFMAKYNPVISAVDNTGPQKNTSELLNTYIHSTRTDPDKKFDWLGESISLAHVLNPGIHGFDFSGGKKPAYLIAGRLMIEAGLFTWPKFASGMRSQLTNYDPEKDVAGKPKIAQDLVATYCMSAFAVQSWFHVDPLSLAQGEATTDPEILEQIAGRETRLVERDLGYARPARGETVPVAGARHEELVGTPS